jgi:hypothetical protein
MTTKRRKIGPRRINESIPHWAMQLLRGERPDRRDPAVEVGLFGWLLGDPVAGLPEYESDEGCRLRQQAGL